MDIVVTLPKDLGVEHLWEKIGDSAPYWEMRRFPNNFDQEKDKVFILTEGKIRGFFTVHNVEYHEDYYDDEDDIYVIIFEKWTDIKHIPMKGFRGFRYRKFEWENMT